MPGYPFLVGAVLLLKGKRERVAHASAEKTKKSESLLSEARRLAEKNGLPPLSPWWRDPGKLISTVVNRAANDRVVRRALVEELTKINEAFRRELLQALTSAGKGKRGKLASSGDGFAYHVVRRVDMLVREQIVPSQSEAFAYISQRDPLAKKRSEGSIRGIYERAKKCFT